MTDVIPPYEGRRESPSPIPPKQEDVVVHVTVNQPSSPSSDGAKSCLSSRSSSGSVHSTPGSTSPSRPPSALPPTVTEEPQSINKERVTTQSNASPTAEASSSAAATSVTSSTPQDTSSPNPSPRPSPIPSASSRKGSTFRRLQPRTTSARLALPSSPLRPQSVHIRTPSGLSGTTRILDAVPARTPETSRALLPLVAPTPVTNERALPPLPPLDLPGPSASHPNQAYRPYTPANASQRPSSASSPITTSPTTYASASNVLASSVVSPTASISSTPAPSGQRSATPGSRSRTPAPYRPGFQPKGVYRPRTDEFLEARKQKNDVDRVERTRLERRLEKLINLHFPHPDQKEQAGNRPAPAPMQNRRASSFFDIDVSSLKGKSAGDLWKGVVSAQVSGKNDIRCQCKH